MAPIARVTLATLLSGWLAGGMLGCTGARRDFPCPQENCPAGFSCLVNHCVADGTVAAGGTCAGSAQCQPPLRCAPNAFICAPPCTLLWAPTPECAAGSYCAATGFPPQGVCTPSECTTDTDCGTDSVCVSISPTANACLTPCTLTATAEGTGDDCPRQPPQWLSCQPLGQQSLRLVCLTSDPSGGAVGDRCQVATTPCQPGLACVEGVCRRYCDPANANGDCADTNTCCPQDPSGASFGLCLPSCN